MALHGLHPDAGSGEAACLKGPWRCRCCEIAVFDQAEQGTKQDPDAKKWPGGPQKLGTSKIQNVLVTSSNI